MKKRKDDRRPGWSAFITKLYQEYSSTKSNVYYFSNKNLVKLVPIKDQQVVLDLGCGNGMTTFFIRKKSMKCKIIAVDQSRDMLRQYRKNIKKYGWKNIKIVHLKAEDIYKIMGKEKVDIILCNGAIWHFNINKIFKVLSRILNTKGILAFTMFDHIYNFGNGSFYLLLEKEIKKFAGKKRILFNDIFTNKYDKNKIVNSLEMEGFKLVKYIILKNKETKRSFEKAMRLYTERVFYKFFPSLDEEEAKKKIYCIANELFKKKCYVRKIGFFVCKKIY